MIIEADEVINAEILFEQQQIDDESEKDFKALLLLITASIRAGDSLKKTKKIIEDANINKDLEKNLLKFTSEQYENITGQKAKLDFTKLFIAGYTFIELIAQRQENTKKQLLRFMVSATDAIKEGQSETQLLNDEVAKYEKAKETFYRTQARGAREQGYAQNDYTLKTDVKGWMSKAVLDNKTSAICMSLHNVFYSSDDYKTRFDLPYQIPRHPNCRSMYITVFKGKSIQSYKGKNLETFLIDNPTKGKELLGIQKYDLFQQKKIKLVNFVDVKNKRFFTNAEIKKKLNLK